MQTPVLATFTGKIVAIAAGVIAAGSTLFTTEAMKMDINQNSSVGGVFIAATVAGALVVAGETVIGYFTPTHEEEVL